MYNKPDILYKSLQTVSRFRKAVLPLHCQRNNLNYKDNDEVNDCADAGCCYQHQKVLQRVAMTMYRLAIKEIVQTVKNAPSGTTYGVVEMTKSHIVVNTPFGRYNINKNEDGSLSFMGMTAKLVAVKNGGYKVKTSLGDFSVNISKETITKK